jgi:hypothetical protein
VSFLPLDTIKARLSTDLSDSALQDLLDEEERYLERHVGPLGGERTETIVLPWRPTVAGFYLLRPTDSVVLTGAGVPIPDDDFALNMDGMFVERLNTAFTWRTPMTATYTPNDEDLMRAAILDLVSARLAQIASGAGAIEFEQIGSYSRRFGSSARTTGSVVRSDVLRRILPPVEVTANRFRYA